MLRFLKGKLIIFQIISCIRAMGFVQGNPNIPAILD